MWHQFWVPIVILGVWLCGGSVKAQSVSEPEMIFVAGGTFTMGCTYEQGSDCASDEKPSHEVQLTGFAIGKYEVTQALWKQVMGNNPSRFKGDSLPVENVTWDDVQMFILRLNVKTGKNYRLPTEAEWEYAARGGQQSRQTQFAGGFDLETVAWCSTNSENATHNVGGRQPNELGLYDMSGNVWEWCSDYYGTYPSDKQTNPIGVKKGTARVLRGGCYAAIGRQCRVSGRKSLYQGGKDYLTGFRLAMDDDREARAAEAARQAEQERIAAEKKAEQERIAAEKAARQAEQERIAAEKKAEQERIAAEKAAAEAARQAEQERIAAEKKAEQERIAAEKAAAEAARQAEQERIAAEKKAEQERIAAEKAAAEAARQAEQGRIAAEKKAEQERIAAEKAAEVAARQAEQERIAAEKKAELDRIAAERQRKAQHRKDSLRALPWNTFFTVNAAASTLPQFSYGFKIGQVKVAGWYFSVMSNFHFKGMFKSFEQTETYVLTGKQKSAKISCTAGLAVRPCQPLSLHIGAGFGYRALTMETTDGWRKYPRRSFMGPEANLGLMFHIKALALSAEAVYTYDLTGSDISWKNCIEARIGVGFMLPNKKK
jgi:formylglycine-generating enzyme required for sulfatase activity